MAQALSDESYLNSTDLHVLLCDLLKQINEKKPVNPWQYSATYFKKVQHCIHILGEDYMTVVACRHNRKSFVYCCTQSFKNFPRNERISVHDFYNLLQLICPDIPLSLIQDSALTGCTSVGSDPVLYCFDELSTSLYFRFIFTEWLIMLENVFFEGKARRASITCSLSKLRYKFEEWQTSIPSSTSQPSLDTLNGVLDGLSEAGKSDVTFDDLISSMLRSNGIKRETTSYRPNNVVESLAIENIHLLCSNISDGGNRMCTDDRHDRLSPSLPGIGK
eukprot:CAMPEP_0185037132 /NCGR_PEP_ID=MMETSP1103-20130426/31102_1 /TAXON_ID=36769 /ORGANISM="Paraphysomonas bandaiensis, Strain Caron Lab Isolate" /LENGTH=275 /DNA_ID=CAMNT_0027574959 /DNA_START=50 /DNA_END=877 /DNA_ORIENTATION=-